MDVLLKRCAVSMVLSTLPGLLQMMHDLCAKTEPGLRRFAGLCGPTVQLILSSTSVSPPPTPAVGAPCAATAY